MRALWQHLSCLKVMNRNLLLVDLSNQAYKAAASHPTLTSSNGEFTGGLYGFIAAMAKAIDTTGATHVCICEDRRPYRRSQLYPEYKQIRVVNKDKELAVKVTTTVEQIRKLCAVTGWPIWAVDEFEADDLIAHATIQYRHRFKKIVAMSGDSDLYQLFNWKHFEMFKGKQGTYRHEDYLKEWRGLSPGKLVMALALTGTHNDVEGIDGVGPVTAIHAMNNPEHLDTLVKLHADMFARNMELILLPHKDFPREEQMPLKDVYDERELQRFCARYDIQLQMWQAEAFGNVK